MRENENKENVRKTKVVVPDFRSETEQEYKYTKRPNQRDYLKGTHWDREAREEVEEEAIREKNAGERKEKTNAGKKKQKPVKEPEKSGKKKKKKQKSTKKKFFSAGKIAMVLLLVISGFAGHIVGKGHAQLNQMLSKSNTGNLDLQEVTIDESTLDSDTQIVNILLVGADKREEWSETGRSDSVMIATLDKKHKRLKLTSLMRDMYIDIPNHGKSKFNAAYSYGGVALLYQTIAYNFDLKLDGYVLVDFSAFKKVINKLGGVDITLTEAEANYLIKAYKHGTETKVKPGRNRLNGRQALAYTRIRQDARGDFGRTARQRAVMQSILTEIKTKSFSEIMELFETILPFVATDFNNEEILSMVTDVVRIGATELDQQRIPMDYTYTQQRINNMAVLVPDVVKNKEKLQEFIFEYGGEDTVTSEPALEN